MECERIRAMTRRVGSSSQSTWARSMDVKHIIHLVDDDPAILNSIAGFLRALGFSVHTYGGPIDFLNAVEPGIRGCLVTDVCMPDMSGLELVTKMGELGFALPTIFMTANADMALKLAVSKHGAIEVLEKPFKNDSLIKAIRKAILVQGGGEAEEPAAKLLEKRFSSLTASEKEVFRLLVQHKSNHLVAREMAMSVRQLERQRAAIMSKMHATTVAELAGFWSSMATSNQLV
jgi:two-component system response regulator FixJ